MPFGPLRDELLLQLIAQREPVRSIAARLGISRQAVHLNMQRLGIDTRSVRTQLVAGLVARRASEGEIAAALRVERKSAYYLALRTGLRRARALQPKKDWGLLALYERCMSGDPDWLSGAEERPRAERLRVVLEELRAELSLRPDPEPLLQAIRLWEQPDSVGPRSQEAVQRPRPRGGTARMRAA